MSTVKFLSLGTKFVPDKFVKPEGSNPGVSSETKNPAKAGFPVSGGEGVLLRQTFRHLSRLAETSVLLASACYSQPFKRA